MSRWPRLPVLAGVTGLLVAGRGRLARLVRTLDQRAGIFAPRGAALYNAVAPRVFQPFYRRVAEEVVSSAAVGAAPEISAVVEIGSGPGELALAMSSRLAGAEVVGIDLAEAMVARASERARTAGFGDRVRFQVADAAALPLPDGSFDTVVSTLSLHHWSDPAAVFVEIGRVLRPSGVALIYDLRAFAYTRHELEAFLAGGPFEGVHVERDPIGQGLLGLFFVRVRLVRPSEA